MQTGPQENLLKKMMTSEVSYNTAYAKVKENHNLSEKKKELLIARMNTELQMIYEYITQGTSDFNGRDMLDPNPEWVKKNLDKIKDWSSNPYIKEEIKVSFQNFEEIEKQAKNTIKNRERTKTSQLNEDQEQAEKPEKQIKEIKDTQYLKTAAVAIGTFWLFSGVYSRTFTPTLAGLGLLMGGVYNNKKLGAACNTASQTFKRGRDFFEDACYDRMRSNKKRH